MEEGSTKEVLDNDALEKRKQKVFAYLKKDKNWIIWGIFVFIAWFGFWIRTRNLSLLKDVTTGLYIPADPDAFAIWRYAKYILENGQLMNIDYMRYYPWGFGNLVDFKFLSYLITYLYKFLHFFNSSITIEYVDILYPAIAFVVGLLFFFLLVKKLFDYRVALLSTLLLTIIPPYLFRTASGIGDKEALGMVFFFMGLYFFYCGWEERNIKKTLLFGVLSGLCTGLMGLVWGGMAFLVSIIGLFSLICFVFLEYRQNQFLSYATWYISFYAFMFIFRDYNINSIIGVYFGIAATLALFVGIFNYIVLKYSLKDGIEKKFKIPYKIFGLIFVIILGVLFSFLMIGPDFIYNQIKQLYITLTSPFGTDRWQLTVAEAHQPYLLDLIGQIGWKFFGVYMAGSLLMVNYLMKNFKKRIRMTSVIIFALPALGLRFSRYSQDASILNGITFVSNLFYFGTFLLFITTFFGYYIYFYYKDKEVFGRLLQLNHKYIFVLIWLVILSLASRTAIRLHFILSVIIVLMAAYFGVKLFEISLNMKKDLYKISLWLLLFLIFINPFAFATGFAYDIFDKGVIIKHSEQTINQAKFISPGYNQQWQIAGKWVRENTPEDAVFSHWWDYGYFVQGGFERATVTDGGNALESLNHFMGRAVLTGQSEIEALEFLKAHNSTNLLIISDEIGKYPAFSSIGSDENWDRYSWLPPFQLNPDRTQETRDYVVYMYTGGSPIDWDFTYKGELFPKGGSAIIGFFIPTKNINGTTIVETPQAIVINNGQQKQIPLECIFANGQETNFNQIGLKGCLMIIPSINGDNFNPVGAALYVSEKVRRTNFARLYLFGKDGNNFKLVYNDENQLPLALYNGRIIGPLKIWSISYPANLKVPDFYYRPELPNPAVKSIQGRY